MIPPEPGPDPPEPVVPKLHVTVTNGMSQTYYFKVTQRDSSGTTISGAESEPVQISLNNSHEFVMDFAEGAAKISIAQGLTSTAVNTTIQWYQVGGIVPIEEGKAFSGTYNGNQNSNFYTWS